LPAGANRHKCCKNNSFQRLVNERWRAFLLEY
jgi:hypothetical protein